MYDLKDQIEASKQGKHWHIFYPIHGYRGSFLTEKEAEKYISEDKEEVLSEFSEEMRKEHENDWEEVKIVNCITDTRYGPIISHYGHECFLQSQAYCDYCPLEASYLDGDINYAYFAIAENRDGTLKCKVRWQVINPNCEDESDACDWEDYETSDY